MNEITLTEQQIENIRQYFDRQQALENRIKEADAKNRTELDGLVNLVNEILHDHGIIDRINKKQIRFQASSISNLSPVSDKKMSEIIFNHIYPKPTGKFFSHYTNFEAGKSIVTSGKFRMYSLLKNFKDDEYKHFYEVHGITVYQNETEIFGVKTVYKAQMSDIFSLFLTTEENDSPTLWGHFAKNRTGVKLTFEINSKIPDFREVYYSSRLSPDRIPLMKDLFDKIEEKTGYPLNFTYISKIGAFFIKGSFENEKEFRFLIKRDSDAYNAYNLKPKQYVDDICYIELPFKSKFAHFKLVKIEKGQNCDPNKFDNLVQIVERKYGNSVEIIR